MEASDFHAQVADAYNHIYDLVYLRTHPLADIVTPDANVSYKKKAWLLHDVLLGVIEELDPGFHAPVDGREKRRYRLLSMRYSEGCPSKAVADALSISLRHYYREHDAAIEAVAAILWQRYGNRAARQSSTISSTGKLDTPVQPAELSREEEAPNRKAMLRAEAAQFHDFGKMAQLGEVLTGVVELAQGMARAKGIHLSLQMADDVATQPTDRIMVRQLLLGVLSYLGEQLAEGEITVCAHTEDRQQVVEVVGLGTQLPATTVHQREEQIATLYELAGLQSVQLEALAEVNVGEKKQIGFCLRLPRIPWRTVLLVDDNSDILELYQRYLQQRSYRSIAVQSGGEALQLASQLQPEAIVLDLMLPEQDGWEVLQRLTNHPDTQQIPVVICSILRARQLALALGAAAFLEKPVDEMQFVSVLDSLTASRRTEQN
jgi:CheY-like chemotaxis protein